MLTQEYYASVKFESEQEAREFLGWLDAQADDVAETHPEFKMGEFSVEKVTRGL